MELLFLFGIGEFVETNPGVVVTLVVQAIWFIIWLVRIQMQANQTRNDLDETVKSVDEHITDKDAHVNQLYIGTFRDRITSLESDVKAMRTEMNSAHATLRTEMNAGHSAIVDKIDAKFQALNERITKR